MVKRFEVWQVELNPTKDSEINKTRLIEKLGSMDTNTCKAICELILETFKYN